MSEKAPAPNPVHRLLIEAGPLVVFFISNSKFGIMKATAIFMVAIVLSLGASWITEKRIPPMPLVTAIFVLVFGGLTLYFDDELFIKLKPTIVNTLFGSILLGGLAMGNSLLKPLMGAALEMQEEGWRKLTFRFAFYFFFIAGLNEYVHRTYSTDTWVSFKVWALMPMTFVFMMSQVGLIKHYEIKKEETPAS